MEATVSLDQFKNWPTKDPSRDPRDVPQPWDLDALGIPEEDRKLKPGAPNTVTPVRIRHTHPTLTTGAQGPHVGELARRLHTLGITTDIGTGANPYTVLNDTVLAAAQRFQEDYGVMEDPSAFGGGEKGRAKAAEHVGPWTWEALIRASDRALDEHGW